LIGNREKLIDVIPAKAGIHFDFALGCSRRAVNKSKIKMDPSFRRDDGLKDFAGIDS
jgi:hypothetical protein